MDRDQTDFIKDIIDKLKLIDYIKPEDIPNIDLYMDQVTRFMDEHLKSLKRFEDDKMLTKTMINNYTKNDLLPSPEKKKYSKDHMLLLIYIYYFKNVLSISDIQQIINPLTELYFDGERKVKLEEIYNETFRLEKQQVDSMTKDIIKKYNQAANSYVDVEGDDKEFLTTFSFICLMCFDIYIKKTIIEKMIDSDTLLKTMKDNTFNKNDKKAEKKADKAEKAAEKKK